MATPANVKDYYEYVYDTDIGELMCWFYTEDAEPKTDSPQVFELRHAWIDDIDIAPKLSKRVVKQIENYAYCEYEEERV